MNPDYLRIKDGGEIRHILARLRQGLTESLVSRRRRRNGRFASLACAWRDARGARTASVTKRIKYDPFHDLRDACETRVTR